MGNKLKENEMRTTDLELMNINDLRDLARERGLKTTKKSEIIQSLADDSSSYGQDSIGTSASIIETALSHVVQANQPTKETIRELVNEVVGEFNFSAPSTNGTGYAPATASSTDAIVNWSEVPYAECDVNGEYVTPPWWNEFVSASKVSHVELKGSAGSGKTLAVHKLAEMMGKRLAVVTADGGLRKRDLIGQREIANGTTYFDAGEFATSAKNGDWALIDEANFADADALGFLNGMTDRAGTTGSTFSISGKVIDVHPDFRCFITRNPGYAGTKNMNEALRDRFWTIEVPPLLNDDLEKMFKAHGMYEGFVQDATRVVSALYLKWEQNNITYQVSPRRALVASQLADEMIDTESENGKLVGSEQVRKLFRDLLKQSILTKVDSKHDRDAVKHQITTIYQTLDDVKVSNVIN